MKVHDLSGLIKALGKNKYVLLAAGLALLLLLLPSGKGGADTAGGQGSALESSGIPMDTESARISAFLSKMEGVGQAEVLLSAEGAVVLCTGAEESAVRLKVTNAVSAYTGLGCDKITVIKMK